MPHPECMCIVNLATELQVNLDYYLQQILQGELAKMSYLKQQQVAAHYQQVAAHKAAAFAAAAAARQHAAPGSQTSCNIPGRSHVALVGGSAGKTSTFALRPGMLVGTMASGHQHPGFPGTPGRTGAALHPPNASSTSHGLYQLITPTGQVFPVPRTSSAMFAFARTRSAPLPFPQREISSSSGKSVATGSTTTPSDFQNVGKRPSQDSLAGGGANSAANSDTGRAPSKKVGGVKKSPSQKTPARSAAKKKAAAPKKKPAKKEPGSPSPPASQRRGRLDSGRVVVQPSRRGGASHGPLYGPDNGGLTRFEKEKTMDRYVVSIFENDNCDAVVMHNICTTMSKKRFSRPDRLLRRSPRYAVYFLERRVCFLSSSTPVI